MRQARTMYHAAHIVVCALIGLGVLEHAYTAENAVVIPRNFLATLTANVGSVLSPTLLHEIQKLYPNRTAVNKAIDPLVLQPSTSILSTTTSRSTSAKPKTMKLTSSTTRRPRATAASKTTTRQATEKAKPEAKLAASGPDSERAQQIQLENQFPFDFRNNFRDFPGAGLQGAGGQLNGGPFADRDPFNSDIYRPFSSPLDGPRGSENGVQGPGGRFGGRESIYNGVNRPFNSPDSPLNYDRFQDFGRFGFDGRFPGSSRFFDQGFRTGGVADRFPNFAGQQDERNALIQNNYRQDLRTNYQNSINNDQGQPFQSFPGASFPQNYAQNSFDFLPSQRFQNPYADGFDRNQQRGPNFPLFFPARPGDAVDPGPSGASSADFNNQKDTGATSGPVTSASRRSGDFKKRPEADDKKTSTASADVRSLQERNQFDRLYFPPLNDYPDVRVQPDAFKQHSIASNVVDNRSKSNVV